MESFFRSLKTERVHLTCYASYQEAKTDLFDYIRFYNHRRRWAISARWSLSGETRAVALNYPPVPGQATIAVFTFFHISCPNLRKFIDHSRSFLEALNSQTEPGLVKLS
ncbi:hypothetical protein DOQ73_23405, partial [Salmonella enterica subsp. enterica]|nr:hypothetical protein [Salmonella enterica subsp. enterica serovar Javiana]